MTDRKEQAREPVVDQALGETLDFMRVIWALDHAMQRVSKRMEKEFGVTGLQRLVIRVVGRFPSISAGRLAGLLHVHPSTLTGVLGRLERNGLLSRRSDPRDRRRSLLGLTENGRRLDVEAEGTIEAAVQRVLEQSGAQNRAVARGVLRAMTDALNTRGAASRSSFENGRASRLGKT